MKRLTKVIVFGAFAVALASLLMPSLNWSGAAAVPIEVEARDAANGAVLPGVQLMLVIEGVPPPANALTPLATTGVDGRGKLVGMFGAGGTRSFIWSSGRIGTDAGTVRCDLAGYQTAEFKLPTIKTRQLFGIGRSPTLRVKATMQPGPG